jgi:hypothetical protein
MLVQQLTTHMGKVRQSPIVQHDENIMNKTCE